MLRDEHPDPTDPPAQPQTTGAEPAPTLATPGPTHPAGQGNTILAIDPGNTESAYTLIDHTTHRPIWTGKIPNQQLLERLGNAIDAMPVHLVAIEMVASYGMPVGAEVFETCVWIGRFQQVALSSGPGQGTATRLVYRRDVKLHHCHTSKAKDSNITQALIDRFASGQPNRGKGTKATPGWFHGFRADIWQAYALAVYVADTTPDTAPVSEPPCGTGAATTTQQEAMF